MQAQIIIDLLPPAVACLSGLGLGLWVGIKSSRILLGVAIALSIFLLAYASWEPRQAETAYILFALAWSFATGIAAACFRANGIGTFLLFASSVYVGAQAGIWMYALHRCASEGGC